MSLGELVRVHIGPLWEVEEEARALPCSSFGWGQRQGEGHFPVQACGSCGVGDV